MEKKGEMYDKSWKSEEQSEFGYPWSESLGFKCGTPIMLGPPMVINGNCHHQQKKSNIYYEMEMLLNGNTGSELPSLTIKVK